MELLIAYRKKPLAEQSEPTLIFINKGFDYFIEIDKKFNPELKNTDKTFEIEHKKNRFIVKIKEDSKKNEKLSIYDFRRLFVYSMIYKHERNSLLLIILMVDR